MRSKEGACFFFFLSITRVISLQCTVQVFLPNQEAQRKEGLQYNTSTYRVPDGSRDPANKQNRRDLRCDWLSIESHRQTVTACHSSLPYFFFTRVFLRAELIHISIDSVCSSTATSPRAMVQCDMIRVGVM